MQPRRPLPEWYTRQYFISYKVLAIIAGILLMPVFIALLLEMAICLISGPVHLYNGLMLLASIVQADSWEALVVNAIGGLLFTACGVIGFVSLIVAIKQIKEDCF